jgi:membrane protein
MEPESTKKPPASVEARGDSTPTELGILYRSVRKGLEDHGKDLAAAIAYYTFFSIFPLLLGITAAAGHLLRSEAAQARVFDLIVETLPGSAAFVRENVESVVRVRGALGVAGVIGLFWSASAAFGAITRAVNRALGAKRPHPFFLSKLRYFLMTLAVSLTVILSVAITAALEILPRLDLEALQWLGVESGLIDQLTGVLTSFAFTFLTFALIYKVTPYVEVRWRQVVPGALLGAVVFELGKQVFRVYLSRIANFEAVYGSLSSIIVLLLWLYVSALVLVFGAEYNIVRWRVRHPQFTEIEAEGG